ncbi:MAG: gliding motility-associated C-terminal domain-containing protein, partial [Flavobacteriia bacterium]|nr:gliding motility-associated C-terminal domain-containing protein [Flavobacteriia bacterium]
MSESSVTACSNTATGSVSIVVNPKPVVTLNASATTICSGSAVTITPSSTPAGATFSWTATGNNTSGANNGTGTVIAANLTATATAPGTATYAVTATLNGCTSDPVNSVITVNPLPVASAQGQTICSGTSTNVALSSNIPGTTFSWTVASSGVSGASNGSGASINQLLTSLTGGSVTYTVTPTAGNCAGAPITVVVNVQAMPAIAVTPSNSSVCQGDQVILTATGGVNYTWTPATGLNTATGATVTATPSATTTYIVTGASSAGCTGTSQAVVTVNSYPNLTVSPDVTVCLGTPVTLTASGAATYTWSPTTGLTSGSGATVTANPSATTTYTVSATSNGCTSTESVTVTVNPLPVVNAGPDQTVCQGSKVTLNATGAVSYSWSDGVTNLVPFTADTTRTYTVTGISADGCTNTDYVTVVVTGAPEVAFTAGRITGCVPLHIQFENLSQGATSYLWSFGDGATSTLEDAFHDYEQNGCFDVTLTAYNGYGCSTAVKMDSMICTLPSPTAAFVASTYEITNVINEVQFNNMSEGATSYKWYFGDETGYSTKEHPKYTYDPNIFRNYNVMLVATNQDGCTDTARVVIRMTEDVVFYVPNSFTPDGDNYNNIFKPVFVEGFDAFEYEMLIFDRWGEVIFETHDINYGWDGTYLFNGGKLCQDGTYVWKITVKKTGVD